MKINNNSKYILYIILFVIFILIRINYVLLTGEIEDISFKGLAISKCFWPFGIIKETAIADNFLPAYYLFTGILRNEILIKIFNSLIALANILVFIKIGKKLFSEKMGLFMAIFLSLNHFFLYYTNLIAPYCLIFLIQTLIINALLDYFKKPSKANFKKLNIFNCILILCDTFGFLFVLCELGAIYLLGKRKKIYSKESIKLFQYSFIAFLIVLPILLIQSVINSKLVIPNTYNGVGFSFSGLYLLLSDYVSPYLTFMAPEYQSKSTLGLIYSFILNPDLKNINSLKIIITLFYSSILPLIIMIFFTIRAYLKNYKLRLLWLISILYFALMIFLVLIEKIELQPIYIINFFITNMVLLGYGIFSLKDTYIKAILITCLIAIQLINTEINAFNITINKNFATINPINIFIKEENVTKDDLLIIPHQGYFAQKYYKKLNVFNYDNKYLQSAKKNGIIKNLSNKKVKTINRKNIHYSMKNYLEEAKINEYLTRYFLENAFEKEKIGKRIILIADKLNSRPVSANSILKCTSQTNYSPRLKKIDFAYMDMSQSQPKALFDALKSKTLYNFINILSINFKLVSIVEYKKIDNEYYKVNTTNSIYKAINSFDSDYVFMIFEGIK
ncbi:hypothetical protein IJX73_02500 [bacterium]|nr:hypothetical protein [bacterium]